MSLTNVYTIEKTRKKILEVALELFQNRGIEETQMKDVAQAANISRGSLYRYYKDKFSLSLDVYASVRANSSELAAPLLSKLQDKNICGLEKMYRAFQILIEMLNNKDSVFLSQFDYYYSFLQAPKDFGKQIESHINTKFQQTLTEVISLGQADGSIDNNIPNHILFVTVLNAITALCQRIIMRKELLREINKSDVDEILKLHTKLLFKGIMGPNVPNNFREYLDLL